MPTRAAIMRALQGGLLVVVVAVVPPRLLSQRVRPVNRATSTSPHNRSPFHIFLFTNCQSTLCHSHYYQFFLPRPIWSMIGISNPRGDLFPPHHLTRENLVLGNQSKGIS